MRLDQAVLGLCEMLLRMFTVAELVGRDKSKSFDLRICVLRENQLVKSECVRQTILCNRELGFGACGPAR